MRSIDEGISEAITVARTLTDTWDYRTRQNFCRDYSWSIPDQGAVEKIVTFLGSDMTVAIGSGHGLWEGWLATVGAIVEATDVEVSHRDCHVTRLPPFTRVQLFDTQDACIAYAKAIAPRALFMSWPPYDESMASDYVAALRPAKIVYVGEGRWGCTANDDFFDILREEYAEEAYIDIPQWRGIHDGVLLFRKTSAEDTRR